MVMSWQLRILYLLRRPKMAIKTFLLVLAPILWLLYFYSSNYVYANHRRLSLLPPSAQPFETSSNSGDILRRPTVPVFEGVAEEPHANCSHLKTFRRGDFTVLSDVLPRRRNFSSQESVTLTTHATYELLDNVIQLSEHWAGPISVAVYAPNTDFRVAFDYALWLRCSHSSVADFVTFHFVYPTVFGDGANQTAECEQQHVAQELLNKYNSCSVATEEEYVFPVSYRHQHHLAYPINVCRNVARLSASTHFVLASDIELYPSANVIDLFLNYSRKHNLITYNTSSSSASFNNKHKNRKVFVLPIFEVDKAVQRVPRLKKDLVQLYREKKAVYFHKHVCSFCNIIPRLNKWLTSRPQSSGLLDVFMTVKRHRPFNRWEPIYIGTNDDPLYDERFSWEGQQDKMTQMYELCLLNYDLAILDSAFLVHRPGIKTKNVTEYKMKATFIAHNNKVYKNSIRELEKKHGMNPWCK